MPKTCCMKGSTGRPKLKGGAPTRKRRSHRRQGCWQHLLSLPDLEMRRSQSHDSLAADPTGASPTQEGSAFRAGRETVARPHPRSHPQEATGRFLPARLGDGSGPHRDADGRSTSVTPKAARMRISQGPEIELAKEQFTVIRWTTNNPGGSPVHYGIVRYGTDPKDLSQTAKNPISSVEANGTSDGVTSRTESRVLHAGIAAACACYA
jgi:hypothetical protein